MSLRPTLICIETSHRRVPLQGVVLRFVGPLVWRSAVPGARPSRKAPPFESTALALFFQAFLHSFFFGPRLVSFSHLRPSFLHGPPQARPLEPPIGLSHSRFRTRAQRRPSLQLVQGQRQHEELEVPGSEYAGRRTRTEWWGRTFQHKCASRRSDRSAGCKRRSRSRGGLRRSLEWALERQVSHSSRRAVERGPCDFQGGPAVVLRLLRRPPHAPSQSRPLFLQRPSTPRHRLHRVRRRPHSRTSHP